MQFRHDLDRGGFGMRRHPENPHFVVPPPFRGGFPIDYGPRIDESWRQGMPTPPPASRNATMYNMCKQQDEQADDGPPSKHLWVGNVSQDTTDHVLKEKFAQFGEVESVTVYPSRNYAFVNLKNQDEAMNAKIHLQGVYLGGFAMRIEFAKGRTAKSDTTKGRDNAYNDNVEGAASNQDMQSRHLWIGGVGTHTVKEQLEAELRKFGPIEEFKILRDRHCAFVDFVRLDDAIAALEGLHRKRVGNDELRVEYGRNYIAKRKAEARGDERSVTPKENWVAPNPCNGFQDAMQNGGDRVEEGDNKGDRDGGPSEVLWIGFPLTTKIEEQTLLNAFSPFGEIEKVKTFPGRTYAFVRFKNKDDAARAKDNLDGKLFSDPRVHIRFSKSEIGPIESTARPETTNSSMPSPWYMDDVQNFEGLEAMGAAPPNLHMRGLLSPRREQHFSSPVQNPNNINSMRFNPGLRPEYRQDSFMSSVGLTPPRGDARNIGEIPFSDVHKPFDDSDYLQGILGGAPADNRLGYEKSWDLPEDDINRYNRDPKRMRGYGGGAGLMERTGFDMGYETHQQHQHGGYVDGSMYGRISGGKVETGYGSGTRVSDVVDCYDYRSGSRAYALPSSVSKNDGLLDTLSMSSSLNPDHGYTTSSSCKSPAVEHKTMYTSLEKGLMPLQGGWQWHGTIAKGGTPVCRARCLSMSKSFDVAIPDVVNCTARTDLDMLAKHVFQAGEYGVTFFVPEGDLDVPPYQDFMHYLGEKHRAGVAKLANGATLFLVPPSEFSEKVLKLPDHKCLFGIILQFKPSSGSSVHHSPPEIAAEHGRSLGSSTHDALQPLHQESGGNVQPSILQGQNSSNGSIMLQGQNSNNQLTSLQLASLASLPGGLTPEFIASLTALLPQQNTLPPNTSAAPSLQGGLGGVNMFNSMNSTTGRAPQSKQNDTMPAGRASLPPLPSQGWQSIQQQQFQQDQQQQQIGLSDHMQSANQGSNMFVPGSNMFAPPVGSAQTSTNPLPLGVGMASSGPTGASNGMMVTAPSESASHMQQQQQQQQQQQGFNGGGGRPPPQGSTTPPQLPSEQLTQLTALLTRPQHPAQQQAAAQLLHHHFQHQHQHQHQHQQQIIPPPPPPPPPLSSSSNQSSSLLHVQSQQQMNPNANSNAIQHPNMPLLQPPPPGQQQSSQLSNLFQQPQQEYIHIPQSQWHPNGPSQIPTQAQPHMAQQPQQPQQQQAQCYVQQQQPQPQPQPQPQQNQAPPQGASQTQGDGEPPGAQRKRFEATLQLAAALLQQMQHQQQQGKAQTGGKPPPQQQHHHQ